MNAFCQDDCDGPGGPPPDPDSPPDTSYTPCDVPLDTWVYILVIAAVIFGTYHLYRKQKALSV
ncbi:hypothetical protein [Mucilaginibacter segetis]|nr:hypothetical protein [Mucilaginibacter segetis]